MFIHTDTSVRKEDPSIDLHKKEVCVYVAYIHADVSGGTLCKGYLRIARNGLSLSIRLRLHLSFE